VAGTPAIDALERSEVPFVVHTYDVVSADRATYGEAVAAALDIPPERAYKTLVAEVDGEPTIAIVAVAARLALKKLAKALGGKRAAMVEPAVAERLTGYVTGGISPFGQKRSFPAVVDATAATWDTVFVSGGRRGLQVEVAPLDLISSIGARVADLV
jgi:Cys-tRNA(Pro)/Cys-tRNA(Cys) deacylase